MNKDGGAKPERSLEEIAPGITAYCGMPVDVVIEKWAWLRCLSMITPIYNPLPWRLLDLVRAVNLGTCYERTCS